MEKIYIPSHICTTFFEDSAILLDSRNNVSYALNDSAANFWKLLIEAKSVKEAITQITKLYDCPPDTLRQDMEKLAIDLTELGFLESL